MCILIILPPGVAGHLVRLNRILFDVVSSLRANFSTTKVVPI